MSHTIQPDPIATEPEPGSNYTPAYREFFERLRRARIDKGLSLLEVAELVGLELPLAYEVENLIAPLPFEWLEVWCQVVGVPFADYLVVYWASEEVYATAKEREAQEKEADQSAPSSTITAADATKTTTAGTASASLNRGSDILNLLRFALARVANFFRSL